MVAPLAVPARLADEPFTTAEALAAGLTKQSLRSGRFRRLWRGVYVCSGVDMTALRWLRAALLVLPDDAVVSHLSAMRLYGLDPPRRRGETLELSTRTHAVTEHRGIRLHRRGRQIDRGERRGLPVTGPERTFIDCALQLSFVELVALGDHLVHLGETSVAAITRFAEDHHLHGVLRARRAAIWVVAGSESPRETRVRLMLVFARLPVPLCNRDIVDAAGRFVARGDLVFLPWKVLVEYDGRHHETDRDQWRRDRLRRERLEALGWRVIVIAAADLEDAAKIPWRVYDALKQRKYDGPPPHLNAMWHQWFNF